MNWEIILWSAGLVLLFVVLYVIFTRFRVHSDEFDRDVWHERWEQVENYLASSNMGEWRLAVIEADKFLDGLLKHKGIAGNSLGERLKVAQGKWGDLRRVWPAHILRNKLVHDSGFMLSHGRAKQAVKDFKKAVKVLGFFDF